MATSPHRAPIVQPAALGALLLLALRHLRALEFRVPGTADVLDAVGASKSRAHELVPRIETQLAKLTGPPGRPPKPADRSSTTTEALTREVLDWLMCNPGAVNAGPKRTRYQPAFRCKILEMQQRHPELGLDDFAAAVRVPAETLRDWLRVERPEPSEPEPRLATIELARIQTLIAAWRDWRGDFLPFCKHVREHLRLPFGATIIGSILEMCGVRRRQRRGGRSADESALRRSFESFFPGAQWVGDGSPWVILIDGQRYCFNLELMIDTHTAAIVGCSVRDTEDAQAVVEAFEDGVRTTGEPPLAVLLDNRASNHTDEVHEALGDAMLIPATLGRAQNKGHVEGAFGLFAQTAPPLQMETDDPRTAARQLLEIAFLTWARTLNHRPRRPGGQSRAQQQHEGHPDPEQVERARQALRERLQRQQAARQTGQARQDPTVRSILDAAFARLGLDDASGNARTAIAAYPIDFVLEGIAIFEGKRHAGTLTPEDDARYLLGIVRNLARQDEGLATADALWRLRQEAGDHLLRNLRTRHDDLAARYVAPRELLLHIVDEAVHAEPLIDRLYWLDAAVVIINAQSDRRALYEIAARRAHASWRAPARRRSDFVRHLLRQIVPLT